VTRIAKPIYESLPAAYLLAGAVLLVLSYRFSASWWSGWCAAAGLLALIAGLAIWMHRRDYRATSADYLRRGKPFIDSDDTRG
jgi:protein-S-isoprenylcysteine O-methyltransferase Ste14